jgi:hypothetical protein
MPYDPHGLFGSLGDEDLKEYDDTGVVLTSFDFNPRMTKVEKLGHVAAIPEVVDPPSPAVPAAYRQIIQVQTFVVAADMEAKMEVVPAADGSTVGLAAVAPAEAIAFANFADGETIHGFVCDEAKLLLAGEVKQSRNPEKPTEITLPATYYPRIAAPA